MIVKPAPKLRQTQFCMPKHNVEPCCFVLEPRDILTINAGRIDKRNDPVRCRIRSKCGKIRKLTAFWQELPRVECCIEGITGHPLLEEPLPVFREFDHHLADGRKRFHTNALSRFTKALRISCLTPGVTLAPDRRGAERW